MCVCFFTHGAHETQGISAGENTVPGGKIILYQVSVTDSGIVVVAANVLGGGIRAPIGVGHCPRPGSFVCRAQSSLIVGTKSFKVVL